MFRGLLVLAATLLMVTGATIPALAVEPPRPETKWTPRVVDPYPDQMPAAGISGTYSPPDPGGFLTLPCLDSCHFVSSIFDHCNPTYGADGRICRFDGAEAVAANGIDFGVGYAMTPGKDDYLYYDGHDGWDLGIYYEPVLAAADGVVTYADWMSPGCHGCGFGRGIRVDHQNGFDTLYGHLWRIDVGNGQAVRRGQVIGISGATGNAAGEHLHWSVYRHGTYVGVDPFGWAGEGSDPWAHDAGNLWLGGAARSPALAFPNLQAKAAARPGTFAISINWASPGENPAYTVTAFVDDAPGVVIAAATHATALTYQGAAGHAYWFEVAVRTGLGYTDGTATGTVDFITGAPPE